MKKVRIMLAAIALFAVAGGSLAFKAAKFGLVQRYTTTAEGTTCNTLTNIRLTDSGTFHTWKIATVETSDSRCAVANVTTVEF